MSYKMTNLISMFHVFLYRVSHEIHMPKSMVATLLLFGSSHTFTLNLAPALENRVISNSRPVRRMVNPENN